MKLDNKSFSREKGKGDVGVGTEVSCSQQVLNKYTEKEEFPKSGALSKEALAGCSKAALGGEGSAKESLPLPPLPPLPPSFPSSITDKKTQTCFAFCWFGGNALP